MMMVMFILPPCFGEALKDISDEDSNEVVVESVLEYLVMEEIVSKPATLLPE